MNDPGQDNTLAVNKLFLRGLLKTCKPSTLLGNLQQLNDESDDEFALLRVRALLELDRYSEAEKYLRGKLDFFSGPNRVEALCLWSQICLRRGSVDLATLAALQAAQESQDQASHAVASAWAAAGYAKKTCWSSADRYMQEALKYLPNDSHILAVQARVFLDKDQRMAALAVYERLRLHPDLWGRVIGTWGVSYISYLMGDFDQAWEIGIQGLDLSPEVNLPVYILIQVSLVRNDLDQADYLMQILMERSPSADGLESLREELDLLRDRIRAGSLNGKRLVSFPTLVQRRDYCGPSTIELVLRYWKNGTEISNDQIAAWVKMPQSGSPMHKMRDFFKLLGYGTVRTFLPSEQIKHMIDLAIPTIVQEEFLNNSHVAVVIGYDKLHNRFEIQDPMNHQVLAVDEDELTRRRKIFFESGLIAFPKGIGLEDRLARSGIFDHPALLWTDQAVIEIDQGNNLRAVRLLEQAVQRTPAHAFSWILLLYTWLDIWKEAAGGEFGGEKKDNASGFEEGTFTLSGIRRKFYAKLKHAATLHPKAGFLYHLRGQAKIMDGKYETALSLLHKAVEYETENPAFYVSLAECYFALRDPEAARSAALQSLELDPTLASGNAWMGRSLAALESQDAAYYAGAAVELDPGGWLGHLALAESWLNLNNFNLAAEELAIAQSLTLKEPEIEIQVANLAMHTGDFQVASQCLSRLAKIKKPMRVSLDYLVKKISCQLEFEKGNYKAAEECAHVLLERFPQDPWGLQYLAASTCEGFITSHKDIDQAQLQRIRDLFDEAVKSREIAPEVIEMYMNYLIEIMGTPECLETLEHLKEEFSEHAGPLLFLESRILDKADSPSKAVSVLEQAFEYPNVIRNLSQLEEAFRIIVTASGPVVLAEWAVTALREKMIWTKLSPNDIERSLGLFLVPYQETKTQAFILLENAHQRDSHDPEVLLGLGKVSLTNLERESHIRQALVLRPGYLAAREAMADYLIAQNKVVDVLDFTSGYERDSRNLSLSHARALSALGFYEQSVPFFIEYLDSSVSFDENVHIELWDVENRCGWFHEASQLADIGSKNNKQDPLWQLRIAIPLLESLKFDRAFTAFRRAVSLGLHEIDQLRFEYRAFSLQNNYTEALVCLQTISTLKSQQEANQHLSWVETETLKTLSLLGEEEIIRDMMQSRNLDAKGWADAAAVLLLGDSIDLAVEFAQNSLGVVQNNISGLNVLGDGLYELGKIQDAMAVFQSMQSYYPLEHSPFTYLALQSFLQGKFIDAYELADRAVRLGAYDPDTWALRGLVKFFMNQTQEAKADLEIAWHRSDQLRRSKKPAFWAVLSHLQQNRSDSLTWLRAASVRKGDRIFVEMLNYTFERDSAQD